MAYDPEKMDMEKSLAVAVKAEEEAADVYRRLKNKVNNFVIRDKLDFLIGEEEKHKKIVLNLFERLFPERELEIPDDSFVPHFKGSVKDDTSVLDLFKFAMRSELKSKEFYQKMAQKTDDNSAVEILNYLAGMEQGHYTLLEGEYKICEANEEYYGRDDFEYDMVHIGP